MKRALWIVFGLLPAWIAFDLARPSKTDFRRFDPIAVGRLDADMWRSYYEKRRLRLFQQLARLMRVQFRAPFWRSHVIAYRAAKAATVFQAGKNREDYSRALPHLERYFNALNHLSNRPFDAAQLSRTELEWWIIRREPEQYTPSDWERLLAETAAGFYGLPANRFENHAKLRVEAMRLRDGKGDAVSEADWKEINRLLEQSWTALHQAVNQ